jgi:hypothetical protein
MAGAMHNIVLHAPPWFFSSMPPPSPPPTLKKHISQTGQKTQRPNHCPIIIMNVRKRLFKQQKSRRGSSVAMNEFGKQYKTGAGRRRAWQPHVRKQFPWLGLLALVGVLIRASAPLCTPPFFPSCGRAPGVHSPTRVVSYFVVR